MLKAALKSYHRTSVRVLLFLFCRAAALWVSFMRGFLSGGDLFGSEPSAVMSKQWQGHGKFLHVTARPEPPWCGCQPHVCMPRARGGAGDTVSRIAIAISGDQDYPGSRKDVLFVFLWRLFDGFAGFLLA